MKSYFSGLKTHIQIFNTITKKKKLKKVYDNIFKNGGIPR